MSKVETFIVVSMIAVLGVTAYQVYTVCLTTQTVVYQMLR